MLWLLFRISPPTAGHLGGGRTLTTNASIWTAAELGDVDRVRTQIKDKGRSPDSLDPHGYTPLHLAAQRESAVYAMRLQPAHLFAACRTRNSTHGNCVVPGSVLFSLQAFNVRSVDVSYCSVCWATRCMCTSVQLLLLESFAVS